MRSPTGPFRAQGIAAPLIAAATLLGGCSPPAQEEPPQKLGAAAPAPLAPGAALYQRYCIACHGADLNSGTAGHLKAPQLMHGGAREAIVASIAEGRGNGAMPGYAQTLSAEQIGQLADFILSERGEQAAASAPRASKPTGNRDVIDTLDYRVNVDTWVEGLETPWALAFLGDGRALVTEKRGTLRLIENGVLHPEPIAGTPAALDAGQGGLLDVTPDPQFAENGWVYLAFSHAKGDTAMTKLVRGRIREHRWVDEETVFEAAPEQYHRTAHHYGCRILFDREGRIVFGIGDRGDGDGAQRTDRANGKIHRVNPDGSIPADNPFAAENGALASVLAYGVRNPQGLALHPVTGAVWESEHGPRGGDEINVIRAGANYGWPVISYGINYDGSVLTRERSRPGMEQPVYFWRPSTGLCAIEFYTGAEFPYWQNHLLVGALAGQHVRLLTIEEDRVLHDELILANRGRVRDVTTGPDGAIYVVLNDPGTVLRLTSAGEAMQ